MVNSPLKLSDRITVLPVVHGSIESALVVRRWMLENKCDLLAVPLPPSFSEQVVRGTSLLPEPGLVIQPAGSRFQKSEEDESPEDAERWSYVPIDPCQPVIMGIRAALGERVPIEFIDLESDPFEPLITDLPDPYALRKVAPERYAAAVLTSLDRPIHSRIIDELRHMGARLRELEQNHRHILCLCSIQQWPWLREAYREPSKEIPEPDLVTAPEYYAVDSRSLAFLFSELPFVAALYERARREFSVDDNLSIDAIKRLLMYARTCYVRTFGPRARHITPLMLSQCLKYMRNLSLIQRRMSPDLYTIVVACQQILGDQFAIEVVECAKQYPMLEEPRAEVVSLSIDRCRLPDGRTVRLVNRLPGSPVTWRTLRLNRRPTKMETQDWRMKWNPMRQCSWPPEDKMVESFRSRVFDRARAIMGAELARSEKFSTSIRDGIDIRETLRHWYDKEIYVKIMPPSIGTLDACVMLFDSPAEPQDYTWRSTWYAEHSEESTIAFYATDFRKEIIGPGLAASNYGGVMFLFPPRPIPDIWTDKRLDFTESMEERLIAAVCLHAQSRQVALVSWLPPGSGWRRLAKRFRKTLVHVPMGGFNEAMIQQLRTFHVLNGQEVRSFAADFIRKP